MLSVEDYLEIPVYRYDFRMNARTSSFSFGADNDKKNNNDSIILYPQRIIFYEQKMFYSEHYPKGRRHDTIVPNA